MKTIIQKNFDKASITYSSYDTVQRDTAHRLMSALQKTHPTFQPEKILDVGCGTGNLLEHLITSFPDATYHINDISTAMITTTQKRFSSFISKVLEGCIESLDLAKDYSLIASNMCLQWMDNLQDVLIKLLERTDVLLFSCLLKESFQDWYALLEHHGIVSASRVYPTQDRLLGFAHSLNKRVLHYSQKRYTLSFTNARACAQYLQHIGAHTSFTSDARDFQKKVIFLRKHIQPCHLTYNIGFFIII